MKKLISFILVSLLPLYSISALSESSESFSDTVMKKVGENLSSYFDHKKVYDAGATVASYSQLPILQSHLDPQRVCTGWLDTLLKQPRPANIPQNDNSYMAGIHAEQEALKTKRLAKSANENKSLYIAHQPEFCMGFVDFSEYYNKLVSAKTEKTPKNPTRDESLDFLNSADDYYGY